MKGSIEGAVPPSQNIFKILCKMKRFSAFLTLFLVTELTSSVARVLSVPMATPVKPSIKINLNLESVISVCLEISFLKTIDVGPTFDPK